MNPPKITARYKYTPPSYFSTEQAETMLKLVAAETKGSRVEGSVFYNQKIPAARVGYLQGYSDAVAALWVP